VASQKRALVRLLPVILLAGCELMNPPPQQDPVREALLDLELRLAAIERVLSSGTLVDLKLQVDELQRQTADIRGRTESLEHSSDGTTSRQRDLYLDLDDRIRYLEKNLQAPSASVGPERIPGRLPVPGGTDRENYEAAFELLKQQRYEESGAAFEQFLASFPNSQLADNAQYWLAEAHYVLSDFELALGQFQLVISAYPRSRKIPDALLKIGYSNYELGRWQDARNALTQVGEKFENSTYARLAEQRLKRMDDEGH